MTESLQLELKYGSTLHNKIKEMVLDRFKMSQLKMANRHDSWAKAENQFLCYVNSTEEDKKREAKKRAGKNEYTTITIPYAYATLMTALTYWASVFLSRNPVLQFTARHGEGHQQVQAVEAIVDYQMQVGRMIPSLYLWLLDAGKYGIGILGDYWTEEKSRSTTFVEEPMKVLGVPIPGKTKRVRKEMEVKGYAGNKIYNIRPYDFIPDPRVTIANLQQGEFCGRVIPSMGWNDLVRRAANGTYINLEELRKTKEDVRDVESGGSKMDLPDYKATPDSPLDASGNKKYAYHLIELVIDLIPKEHGLGEGSYPEKWVFTLGEKKVVIGAQPLGLWHNNFPYLVQSYEVAGYQHSDRGMLEVLSPLNDTLDWLINSHFFNVRKTLNDQLILDPSRIVMKDILEGGPGRILRLAPQAYGQDVRTIVTQLQTSDVTRTHLQDLSMIVEMIQRVSGVTDNLMGLVYQGGRKTATEVRSSNSFGINRLRTFAEYNSALGWSPLAQMILQNTQQLYEEELTFKIAGDLMAGLPRFEKVSPEDIQGFYEFVPVDGTLPIDRFAQANLWKEILGGLAQMPQIAMQYDLGGIFAWMAQIAGLKNISQFKINVQPGAVVQEEAKKGNLIPLPGGGASAAGLTGALSSAG